MKYSRQQIYTISAAVLFLFGAVFMLINTFAPVKQSWAFIVGCVFAVLAAVVYILLVVENRKNISKKLTDTGTNTKNEA